MYNLLSRRDLPGCYRIGKVWRSAVEKVKAALQKPAVRQALEEPST